MNYTFDRKIRYLVLAISLGFFVCAAFFMIDCFFPFGNGVKKIGFWTPFIFETGLGLSSLYIYFIMPKMTPRKRCIEFGIWGMVLIPITLIGMLVLCFLIPSTISSTQVSWLFIVEAIVIALQLFALIAFAIILGSGIKEKNHGLLPVFSNMLIALFIHSAVITSFIFSAIRAFYALSIYVSDPSDLQQLTMPFLITIGTQLFIGLIIVIIMFLISYMSIIAGKEDKVLGVLGTYKFTTYYAKKYHATFWAGNIFYAGMLIFAIVSTVFLAESYLSFINLYGTMLIIRIPVFFWERSINKSDLDDHTKFQKLHGALIYSGIFLLLLGVSSFFIGWASVANAEKGMSVFMTYIIFIPWALYRMIKGIRGLWISYTSGDPSLLVKAYLDMMVALVTIGSAIFYVASSFKEGQAVDSMMVYVAAVIFVVGVVVAIFSILYVLVVGIRLLVSGVMGLMNKRDHVYKKYQLALEVRRAKEGIKYGKN